MSKKEQYLNDFVEEFNKKSKYTILKQYRPQTVLYESEPRELSKKDWYAANNFRNFCADMYIETPKLKLLIESDGDGWGHKAKGAADDRIKNIQYVRMGFVTIRFAAQELKKSPAWVIDTIEEILEVWNG